MSPQLQKRVDALRVLELRMRNGLSYGEIARQMGISKATVHSVLEKFKSLVNNSEVLEAYEKTRARLLSAAEFELLKDLADTEKRQNASLNNVAYAFTQVQNARRLEEGKSTENISYADMTKRLEEIKDEIKRKRAELEAKLLEEVRGEKAGDTAPNA